MLEFYKSRGGGQFFAKAEKAFDALVGINESLQRLVELELQVSSREASPRVYRVAVLFETSWDLFYVKAKDDEAVAQYLLYGGDRLAKHAVTYFLEDATDDWEEEGDSLLVDLCL